MSRYCQQNSGGTESVTFWWIGEQIKGVVIIGIFVFVVSLIIWGILKSTMGIRVSEEVEYEGIDTDEFGLRAYPEFTDSISGVTGQGSPERA